MFEVIDGYYGGYQARQMRENMIQQCLCLALDIPNRVCDVLDF